VSRPYTIIIYLLGTQFGTFLPFFFLVPTILYPFQQGFLPFILFFSIIRLQSLSNPIHIFMYVPSKNIESPGQEIVCVFTGESYVYLEGNDKSLTDPKVCEGSIEQLPLRFFRQPWVINTERGVRVFGNLE